MKKIKLSSLILLAILSVYIIEHNISVYNTTFYQGKDGGFFFRIESIVFLSTLLFFIMSSNRKLLKALFGFIIGLISSVISYFLWFNLFSDNGLSFHIISLIIVFATHFSIEYFENKKK